MLIINCIRCIVETVRAAKPTIFIENSGECRELFEIDLHIQNNGKPLTKSA